MTVLIGDSKSDSTRQLDHSGIRWVTKTESRKVSVIIVALLIYFMLNVSCAFGVILIYYFDQIYDSGFKMKTRIYTSVKKILGKIKPIVWRIMGVFSANCIVETNYFKIKVSSRDNGIGRNFYLWGGYGLSEIDKAFEFLRKNNLYKSGTLLDIGANIGHVTLYCLSRKYCNYSICVEPDDFNFKMLQDNVNINLIHDKVLLKQTGLGSKSGKVNMILSQDNFGDHRIFTASESCDEDKYNLKQNRQLTTIEIDRLDDLVGSSDVFDNVNFISLDVQGFELEVLQGGVDFFSQGIPMMLEVDPYLLEKKGSNIDMLFGLLSNCYTHFISLSDVDSKLIEISKFIGFYNGVKEGEKDYADVLFISNSRNTNG